MKQRIRKNLKSNKHEMFGKLFKHQSTLGIIGIVLVALALRPSIVSIGPVLTSMSSHFGLSHTTAGLLTTIPDVLMGILALPTPWLATKYGRDKMIIAAMALLCLSTLARAFSPNVFILLLTTAGVGIGIAVTGTLLSGFVKATFAKRAAVVMGIYSTALALGSTMSAVFTAPISEISGSWRVAIGVYSFLGLLGVIAWRIVSNKSVKIPVDVQKQTHVKLPWNNPVAWKIALFFACVNLLFYALLAWIAALFVEYGLSQSAAGGLLGCFTVGFMFATPIVGMLSKSHDRRAWLAVCSFLTLIGLVIILKMPNWMPMLAVFITAFGLGGTFTLGMTLPLDHTGTPNETNAWTAFTLTIGYLIAALGPLGVGILRDYTGNFISSIAMLIAVAVIMLGLAFFMKHPVEKDDKKL